MKNILLKISLSVIALFVFVGSNIFVSAQNFMDYTGSHRFNGWDWRFLTSPDMAGISLVLFIISILLVAFWIWMLVHAINHKIQYKPVWILVLWFMNILGAIVYYLAVKKNCTCCEGQNDSHVCVCDPATGICTCGAVSKHTLNKVDKEMDKNDANY